MTVLIIEFSQKGTTVLEIDIRQIRYTTVMEINISWYVHHGPGNIISQNGTRPRHVYSIGPLNIVH